LYGNDLRHPILKHLRSDREAKENAKPFLKRGIVFTPVDNTPHRSGKYRHHQQPERLYPEEIRVAAIAGKDK
jgi:hypothetical protein